MEGALEREDRALLRRLLGLFTGLTAVCLLAGASRMTPPAWQMRAFGDVLRVREALSMFVFAPAIGVFFWLIARCVGRGRPHVAVQALMVLAVYFVACGMGMHDPLNRMQDAYTQAQMVPEVWRTLAYLDDELGHWVFWGGFVLGTWVLGIQQVLTPLKGRMTRAWRLGFAGVSAALLWVMLTNLWEEYPKTRVDLCVIALAVAGPLAAHVALRREAGLARLPVLLVVYPAYFGSLIGTLAYWAVKGIF